MESNDEPRMRYYDDDGTEVNPDLFPKPSLCLNCRNNDDPNEILCNLTRLVLLCQCKLGIMRYLGMANSFGGY